LFDAPSLRAVGNLAIGSVLRWHGRERRGIERSSGPNHLAKVWTAFLNSTVTKAWTAES
jgi:hypothetical protein